ncbi:hypothetical protein GCM10028805_52240 [Spirosoma harenae]
MTANSGYIPRKPNTRTPKFEADPMNSTFRWELYLTAGRAGNKVPMMDGYSKGMGFENTNKVELLYKKLINPLLPYMSKCDVIIVYEQNRALPKHLHTKLLELYPRSFGAHSWLKDTPTITDFIGQYYAEYLKSGTMPPIEDRRKNVRQPVYMKELDHSIYQFKSLQQLKDFCREKSPKYSEQCMFGWFHRHADFQPELFEVANLAADLSHAASTSTTAEGAGAAVNAIDQMNNKFKVNR